MRRGMIMVLVSGLLTLFLLLAAAFAQMTEFAGAGGEADRAGLSAKLAAESGMNYAAARLMQEPYPTAASPRDDWTAREKEPLDTQPSRLLNPSYPHGEPWQDADGNGSFSNDPFDDVNGNGRYDVRSGHLRGGPEFALRIQSPGAKIPVNVGSLAPPDHNKPTHATNKPLRNVLCALGAVVLDLNPAIGREDKPAGTPVRGEPIRLSKLGDHLIAARPPSGYTDLDEVRAVLESNGYSDIEQKQLLPFLTVLPDERPEQGGIWISNPDGQYCEPTLDAVSVPHEILRALWLYQLTWSALTPVPSALATTPFGSPEVRAGGNILYKDTLQIMIYPDEAEALADWFVNYRRQNILSSWRELRADLVGKASTLFRKEFNQLAAADPATAASWVRAKADLAFFAMTHDIPSYSTYSAWVYWGLDHGYPASAIPAFDGPFTGFPILPLVSFRVKESGWFPATGLSNTPYKHPGGSGAAFFPTMTLAPPTRFEVESSGASPGTPTARTGIAGILATTERISFTSQEDFENLEGGAGLFANDRIVVDDPQPETRRAPTLDNGHFYPQIASLPAWNLRGAPPDPAKKYSRQYGALGLTHRAFGPEGAGQYWPILEDYDAAPPDPYKEFGSEASPPYVPLAPDSFPMWNQYGHQSAINVSSVDELPGIAPGGTGPIPIETSISFWARDVTYVRIIGGGGSGSTLDFQVAEKINSTTGIPEVAVGCSACSWYAEPGGWTTADMSSSSFPLYSETKQATLSDWHFVAFTMRPVSPSQSEYTLSLNGDMFPPIVTRGPRFCNALGPGYELYLLNADEIRLHDRALSQGEINGIWRKGRYVNPPSSGVTFTSPKYVLGEGARILRAGWLGLPSGDDTEKVKMTVAVRGYDPTGNLLWTAPLGPTDVVTPLYLQGKIAAFDYVVTFQGDGVTPLYRTPRFESIWLQFDRRGRAGRYLSWEPVGR